MVQDQSVAAATLATSAGRISQKQQSWVLKTTKEEEERQAGLRVALRSRVTLAIKPRPPPPLPRHMRDERRDGEREGRREGRR